MPSPRGPEEFSFAINGRYRSVVERGGVLYRSITWPARAVLFTTVVLHVFAPATRDFSSETCRGTCLRTAELT